MINLASIAVDWGSSNIRIWALDDQNEVLGRTGSDNGAGTLQPEEFEPVLLKLISSWLPEVIPSPIPVMICGMAGSRQGWQEAEYAKLPASLDDLPGRAICISTSDKRINVRILPGLCNFSQSQPDVMRGEETQLMGLVSMMPDFDGLVCLPGTHSKWAKVLRGDISVFRTHMTGELFAIISEHSFLRHSVTMNDTDVTGSDDISGFEAGLKAAEETDTGALPNLFSIRARGLLFDVSAIWSRSCLSGLLIGSEIRQEIGMLSNEDKSGIKTCITLLGASKLVDRYEQALHYFGHDVKIIDAEEATLRGLVQALNHRDIKSK